MNIEEANRILRENISYTDEIIREAIEVGADINALNNFGEPISKVILSNYAIDSEIVELLFNANIKIDIENNDGETALYEALSNKDWRKANFLIKKDANIDAKNKYNETLLTTFLKICIGDYSPVHYLIENAANVNIINGKGESTLMIAARKNDFDIMELLISKGASIHYPMPYKKNSHISQNEQHDQQHNMIRHKPEQNLYSTICYAAMNNNLKAIELILKEHIKYGLILDYFFIDYLSEKNKKIIEKKYDQIYELYRIEKAAAIYDM